MGSNPNPPGDQLSGMPDVQEPRPQQKVVDRPHWIAILIGIFSPTVGICALIISLMSLQTGERSLEIGQRAYLALYDSAATITKDAYASAFSGRSTDVQIVFTGTIKNLGNTPARVTSFRTEYKDVPTDWQRVPGPYGPLADVYIGPRLPGQIPPKDQIAWTSSTDFITMNLDTLKNLQDREMADLALARVYSPVPRVCTYVTCGGSVTLRMEDEDVFHKRHEMQWTERLVDAHIAVLTEEEKNRLKQP